MMIAVSDLIESCKAGKYVWVRVISKVLHLEGKCGFMLGNYSPVVRNFG